MSFTAPANITITADASDSDGSVTSLEFYNGNIKLGSASEAPYSFNWNNVGAGIYTLTAIATDNKNSKTISAAISISVNNVTDPANQPPVVIISNPLKGHQYDDPASVEIEVAASDPDGTISKVELYNGSAKLVELTSAPYIFTWKDVKTGSYSIKAVAYDNLNATAISSLIEFTVGDRSKYDADSEIINLYPNPNDGHFSIEILKPLEDEKCKIVISDLGGKQVSNVPVFEAQTLKHIDLSYIKSGIYIMMVVGKGILVTKKFIKY
jgi:chitinase